MALPNVEEPTAKYQNLAIAVFRTSVLGIEQVINNISPVTTTRQSPPNPEKMVHNIRTKDEFQDALKKYPIVVVDFYSTHSAESKHIAATFAHAYELDKFKDFRFVKIDIDDLKDLAEEVGVTQPATFHMYKNGEKINDLQSEHKEDLIQFLETGL
ncbi:hypothetical protein FOVSG1_011741 [Fusarium oxysporum f. sp. vasinfectum]